MTGVTGANASGAYNAANNHDPDVGAQSSTGTVIVVPKVNGAGLAAIAPAVLRPAAIGGPSVTARGLMINGAERQRSQAIRNGVRGQAGANHPPGPGKQQEI